jgi:hypothetical protein
MPSLSFAQAKVLLAPYFTSQGPTDPAVGAAINFVNERFISSGQWKGNRFIKTFSVGEDSEGNYYFDTIPGVESVLRAIAVDYSEGSPQGEIVEIMGDWYPFNDAGLGFLPPNYAGDTQIIRQGPTPASALPSGSTADTQRYRVIGRVPENRTMYCIVRRGYVPLVNNNDQLIPSNRNAYRYGIQAFNYENVNELERAQVYWQLAYQSLNEEAASFEEGSADQVDIQTKAFSPSLIQNLI